jgi:glyoxylase-like metal-dependent hydrolase (beta-lactamase superfamily II)
MTMFPQLLLASVGAAAILGIATLGHGAREPVASSIRSELEYRNVVNRSGQALSARSIQEIVRSRVYALSGFDLTEYHFFVSDDGEQLVAIDAGTSAYSAKAAYEALRNAYPELPLLTTVLVTQANRSHVGGHRYFRSLDPAPLFIAHETWREQIEKDDLEDVRTFKPEATVARRIEFALGGTRVELIPARGGDMHDALFVHLPDLGVLFSGERQLTRNYNSPPAIEAGK